MSTVAQEVRSIRSAARLMLVMGIVALIGCPLLTMLAITGIGEYVRDPKGFLSDIVLFMGIACAGIAVFCLAAGVGWVLCSIHIRRGKRWAVTLGLVFASLAAAIFGLPLLMILLQMATSLGSSRGEMLLLIIGVPFSLAIVLIVFLTKSYRGLSVVGSGTTRGFAVILPAESSPPLAEAEADPNASGTGLT